jgi:hypothetical protein
MDWLGRILLSMVLGFGVSAVMPASGAETGPTRDCVQLSVCPYTLDVTVAEAAQRLREKPLVYWIDGDMLRIAARSETETVRLCCTFQDQMQLIGADNKGACGYLIGDTGPEKPGLSAVSRP